MNATARTTVTVTGGAGYVGSALVPLLLGQGHRVRVLDLFLFGENTLPAHPLLEIHRGDVRDGDAVRRAVRGADAVVHLAGIANDPSCELDPGLSQDVNVAGARMVIDAARSAGVRRFVYASSASVYGVAHDRAVAEDARTAPITVYGTTKLRVEQYLAGKVTSGFSAVAVRPAALYGYAPRQRLDLTVNLFVGQAVTRGEVTVFGGGQWRPTLHVLDLCDLLRTLLERGPAHARELEIYNAAAENASVAQLADRVVTAVNRRYGRVRSRVVISAAPADDRRSYSIDSCRAAGALGFVPRRTIEDAADALAFPRDPEGSRA
ncbi:MAG: hypothetical protein AUG49_09880 [Catenulispora sp. 13_1_20CM_3_70_7]|nr:MAG: hypothetical protein AUG49_09880 [Catenulispora sp. 13_1_20CM_3_70_7]